jgi:small-conductance mechanosensitive channel
VAWFVLKKMITVAEKRVSGYDFIQVDTEVFHFLRKGAFYLLFMAAGTIMIRILDIRVAENIFHAVMIIMLSIPVKEVAILLLSYLEKRVAGKTETRIDDILFELLNRFSGAIIFATAIVLALDVLGINVMPFVAGAGVAGVAIGFAAKDTLSNLIAGVLLIIDRPFEVGDRIEVWSAPRNSATWGDVIDIGLRATRIRTTDNIVIIIPNNEIMTRDIVNYTAINEKIRVRINIGVAYDTDIARAKEIIVQVAGEMPWAATDPAPVVVVKNFGESAVDLQLRVWINNARKRIHTISHVTDRVKEAFDQAGIEIPFPRRDITVVERISKDMAEKVAGNGDHSDAG